MQKVYHLEIKETGEHEYFGSLTAMFHNKNLGVTRYYFYKHKDKTYYENSICIIRKGLLETTKTKK